MHEDMFYDMSMTRGVLKKNDYDYRRTRLYNSVSADKVATAPPRE